MRLLVVRAFAAAVLALSCIAITDDASTAGLQGSSGLMPPGVAEIGSAAVRHGRLQCRRYFGCMPTDRAPLGFTGEWEDRSRIQR
jgi:hypothetical protein